MIAIFAVMLRMRAAHAATMFVLAVLAVGAAVAAPIFVAAAQRSVTQVDLSGVTPADASILSRDDLLIRPDPAKPQEVRRAAGDRARAFDRRGAAALTIPGFARVFSTGFDITMQPTPLPVITDPKNEPQLPEHWLEFREGACAHVAIVGGRCPAASGEVMVGEHAASDLGLRPGGVLYLRDMFYHQPTVDDPGGGYWSPSGKDAVVSVVGVYRTADLAGAYFLGAPGEYRGGDEPVFADRATVTTLDHQYESQQVLAYPTPAGMAPDTFTANLDRIRAAVASIKAVNTQPQAPVVALVDQVAADRVQVAVLPGVLELPLIVLCCFVVFLAAASSAQARRVELGMVKLRGTGPVDRLWLASAEVLLPLCAGGLAGFLLGQLGVWLLAQAILPFPTPLQLNGSGGAVLVPAALTVAATLAAGLLGVRRDLATPVADLLRGVPARGGRWAPLALRVVVVVLAIAAVIQVRTGGPELSGVGVLAPAAVVLAFGLLFALGFDPVAQSWGRRAVSRGRVGTGMAMLHLGRRRSGSRVVALLVVAVGLVGYAGIAYGTGTLARTDEVVASLGAHEVVTVQEQTMRQLLRGVRAADPDGRFAMAVMPIGANAPVNGGLSAVGGATTVPAILAVDSTRLGVIGPWPRQGGGGLDAAAAQAALRPRVGPTPVVRGTGLTLTATMSPPQARFRVHLAAILAPLDGSEAHYVPLPPTSPSATTYHADVSCPVGCRVSTLAIADFFPQANEADYDPNQPAEPVTVTLSSLRQTGPDAEVVSPAGFGTWVDRQAAELTIEPSPAGAAVTVGQVRGSLPAWVGPGDLPNPLPILSPSGLDTPPLVLPLPIPTITAGLAAQAIQVVPAGIAARTAVLPRVGAGGVLVDMEYLIRAGEPGPERGGGEVWLGPAAPANALELLRAAGFTVLGVRDFGPAYARASGGAHAVGLQFLLAVGLFCLCLGGTGLAVAATVELGARARELRSLRQQGASRATVSWAGRMSYLVMIAAGALGGAGAAVMAWLLTRDRLPVADQLVGGVPLPTNPGSTPVVAWLGATAILVVAALVLSSALSRAIRTVGVRGPRDGARVQN